MFTVDKLLSKVDYQSVVVLISMKLKNASVGKSFISPLMSMLCFYDSGIFFYMNINIKTIHQPLFSTWKCHNNRSNSQIAHRNNIAHTSSYSLSIRLIKGWCVEEPYDHWKYYIKSCNATNCKIKVYKSIIVLNSWYNNYVNNTGLNFINLFWLELSALIKGMSNVFPVSNLTPGPIVVTVSTQNTTIFKS